MNERINGLWWKARIGYNNQNCDPEVLEKFAKLIVKECANRASWAQDTGEKDIGDEILKHFGVNEE